MTKNQYAHFKSTFFAMLLVCFCNVIIHLFTQIIIEVYKHKNSTNHCDVQNSCYIFVHIATLLSSLFSTAVTETGTKPESLVPARKTHYFKYTIANYQLFGKRPEKCPGEEPKYSLKALLKAYTLE